MRLSAMTTSPGVFQVFCSYETIHACWDGRRAENVRTSVLGLTNLLFRNCVVVGVDRVIRVVVNMVRSDVGIVAILL